jgi:SNF2 family DNA or RNA helicase
MQDIALPSLLEKLASLKRSAKPWKPWNYQKLGLRMMLEDPRSGLLLDPGMGKTSITLAEISIRLAEGQIKRALIIAPKRALYEVWPQEMAAWKDFHHMRFALVHGPNKDKVLRSLKPYHNILLINPESFLRLARDPQALKLLNAQELVIDESSFWKEGRSLRFKALRPLLEKFNYRHILTGSPRPKNYLDLWSQIYILDRGAALGQYVSHFRNEHFYRTGYGLYTWALLDDHDKVINERIAPMVLRLDARDHLKLPQTPSRVHKVTMPASAARVYADTEDKLMSTLFSQPLVNSAAARAKCCQIANGAVYVDDPEDDKRDRKYKVIHTKKVEALLELYDELQGEPLLVGIGYYHDVTQINKVFGSKIPCLNGGTSTGDFSRIVADWNAGRLPLLLGHPASMGHALNMQACGGRHIAYFCLPDNYNNYDQMFRRVWRQGNKAPFCMRHHFITAGTVDEAKMANLKAKGNGQNAFLQAMKEYALKKGLSIIKERP